MGKSTISMVIYQRVSPTICHHKHGINHSSWTYQALRASGPSPLCQRLKPHVRLLQKGTAEFFLMIETWEYHGEILWEYLGNIYIYIFIFIYLFIDLFYAFLYIYIYGGFLSHVGSPVVTGWLLSYTKSLSSRLFAGYPTMMTIPRTKPMAQMAISSWLPLSLTWGSSSQ